MEDKEALIPRTRTHVSRSKQPSTTGGVASMLYEMFTRDELRAIARQAGVSQHGTKEDMVLALAQYIKAEPKASIKLTLRFPKRVADVRDSSWLLKD